MTLFETLTSMEPLRAERSERVFDANDAKDFLRALASSFAPFWRESSSFPSFPLSESPSSSLHSCPLSESGMGILDSHSILLPIIWGSSEGDLGKKKFLVMYTSHESNCILAYIMFKLLSFCFPLYIPSLTLPFSRGRRCLSSFSESSSVSGSGIK